MSHIIIQYLIVLLNLNTGKETIIPKSEIDVHLSSSCTHLWVSIVNHLLTFILDNVYLKMSIFPRPTDFETIPPLKTDDQQPFPSPVKKIPPSSLTLGTLISIK